MLKWLMDKSEASSKLMEHPLFANNSMLSAVASLLKQHQGTKEKDLSLGSPMLVLTSLPGKDSLHANVVLGSDSRPQPKVSTQDEQYPSLEDVHALARASLVASTQLDIAQQLAKQAHLEEDRATKMSGARKDRKPSQRNANAAAAAAAASKKAAVQKGKTRTLLEKKSGSNSSPSLKVPESPQPKALVCSFEGCNRKFAWQNHLNYHEMTHTNNRQHKCPHDECGKMFYTAQRLIVHLRTHTGEKPFQCSHSGCGKMFTTAGNLKNHERIHTGEQPFVCDVPNCNRRFTEHSSLRKHKRTHSGDKPFECPICGKKFTQSGSRHHHMNRHQLDEEIRASYAKDRHHQLAQQKMEEDIPDSYSKGPQKDLSRLKAEAEASGSSEKVLLEDGSHLACPPQVLVLNNTYPGLPTSESIVFSHGLSDHIVTVTTQAMDHSMEEPQGLSLSHTMLNADGLPEESLQEKSSELVVLSEAPIYHPDDPSGDIVYATDIPHGGPPGDIVYTTDILDHEEVTCANYVTTEVTDYTNDITHTSYTSHSETIETTDYASDISHSSYSTHPEQKPDYGEDIVQANYTSQPEVADSGGDFHSTMMGHGGEHFVGQAVKIKLPEYVARESVHSEYGCGQEKRPGGDVEPYQCSLGSFPDTNATGPPLLAKGGSHLVQ